MNEINTFLWLTDIALFVTLVILAVIVLTMRRREDG